jgi:hypothetical protein
MSTLERHKMRNVQILWHPIDRRYRQAKVINPAQGGVGAQADFATNRKPNGNRRKMWAKPTTETQGPTYANPVANGQPVVRRHLGLNGFSVRGPEVCGIIGLFDNAAADSSDAVKKPVPKLAGPEK